MNGDHRTLNAHGTCARENSPTMRMSTPMERIQSGMAYQTSPRGSPEANERSATAAVRQELMARARFESAPSAPLTSAPRPVELFHRLELRALLFLAPPKLLSHDGRRALERRPSRVSRRAELRPSKNYRREIERHLLPHRVPDFGPAHRGGVAERGRVGDRQDLANKCPVVEREMRSLDGADEIGEALEVAPHEGRPRRPSGDVRLSDPRHHPVDRLL